MKHYFIGDKRIASKLGTGRFNNVYGISGNNVTAGQKDYAARMMQIEKQREEYYKSFGTPPGVPTMKGATADPDNTGRGYNDIIGDLGDHSVPEGWVQRPKFNEKGDVPGPPIQWQKPEDPDNAQPGYGYVPTDTTNIEDIFFYHSDHLGSTSYITDDHANITQYDAYLPYGELLVDEHSSSEDLPYKFNGKQFDEETGLYYYGARYLNPMASIWYGVDPLVEKYMNLSAFIYCHGNPIRFIDFDGRWFWEKDENLHAEKNDNTKTMADFGGLHKKNALEILHRNKIRIGKGGKIKVKDLSKLTLNKNSLYVMMADKSGVVLEDKTGPAVMMGPYAESSASSPNSNSCAILHYYFGHGEAADVGDHATEQLMNTSVYQDNVKVVTTQRRSVADFTVDMTSRVFHIGRTPVSYKVYPGERTSTAVFTLYANKHGKPDSFSDPLDINKEVGGTPYNYKPRTVTYFFKPIGK